MLDLRIVDDFVDTVDGGMRHVVGLEAMHPLIERAAREVRVELDAQRLVLLDAARPGREARVARELRRLERLHQPLPELLERGQVDRDQPLVGGPEDIGLCEPRAVRRGRGLVEREECGERLHREMRHRLEHRHLDVAAAPRAAPLDERPEDAVRGVQAGDRIGERRTEELRAPVVDHHAQETAQGLRHRVVARPVRVRTARTEAADRAADQARIEGVQSRHTGAQTLGGARAEVLDVDISLAHQAAEQLAVLRIFHVEREAAPVAVIGLKVR